MQTTSHSCIHSCGPPITVTSVTRRVGSSSRARRSSVSRNSLPRTTAGAPARRRIVHVREVQPSGIGSFATHHITTLGMVLVAGHQLLDLLQAHAQADRRVFFVLECRLTAGISSMIRKPCAVGHLHFLFAVGVVRGAIAVGAGPAHQRVVLDQQRQVQALAAGDKVLVAAKAVQLHRLAVEQDLPALAPRRCGCRPAACSGRCRSRRSVRRDRDLCRTRGGPPGTFSVASATPSLNDSRASTGSAPPVRVTRPRAVTGSFSRARDRHRTVGAR